MESANVASGGLTQLCYYSLSHGNNETGLLIWQDGSFPNPPPGVNIGIEDDATTSPETIGVFDGGTDFHHLLVRLWVNRKYS